jgi:carboxyl-terminal processing protease
MRRLRLLSAATLLLVLLTACDPLAEDQAAFDQPAAESASPPVAAGVESADQIARGGDTLVRGLALLGERYVGGADVPRLLAAGQRGAWHAIAQSGVPPRDVDAPPDQGAMVESLQGYRNRYARTAQAYASKVDPVWLSHQMLRQAADSLDDCHTGFLSAKQVRDQMQRMSGSTRFGGVGVIIRRAPDENGFLVVEVFDGGPAEKAGMRPGDRVVSVDGENLTGMGIEQVVQLVRGEEGSTVRLGVRRGSGAPSDVAMVRAQVAAPILKAQILDGNIGYLHFYAFPEPLTGQVDQALREFERRNVRAVIVDLRDNSGGQLDVVTKVTSRFVQDGPLFQGVGLSGERTVYKADGSYWKPAKPLVVLTNAGTGSGGEIFAAAVKEHRAGLIVGTTTSGCVSTGQLFPLPDGSALEIATNRVLSGVGGVELNKVGVSPNVQVPVNKTDDVVTEREQQMAKALEIIQRG